MGQGEGGTYKLKGIPMHPSIFFKQFICQWTDLKQNMSGLPHHPGEQSGSSFIEYLYIKFVFTLMFYK